MYPGRSQANRWVTTRSSSTRWPRCSPTSSAGTFSRSAARAASTAATVAESGLARAIVVTDEIMTHGGWRCQVGWPPTGQDGLMTDLPDPTAPGGSKVARGLGATARATRRAGSFTVRTAKRAAEAQGAGESGLARLIQMHFFNTAGDAAVAISLAGTLFFTVPSGQARGQVALFLGLTMLPFAIVAPLIGPFLDRFAHGRRWAIGATMAIRCFLCWVLAGAVHTDSRWLFPAALGVLVASKAYGVTRAAAVPRLLPRDFTLVKANGRVSMSGIVAVAISAPLAGLASLAGPEWVLRYAFLLFVAATIAAIRLPSKVDSSAGEDRLSFRGEGGTGGGGLRMRMPSNVAYALR